MNQQVESYLKEVLEDALNDVGITGVSVITGTSNEIIDPAADTILVTCDELEGVVKTLKIGKARVMARTSSLSGDRTDHAGLSDLISAVFHSPLPAAFLMGITGVDVSGAHVTSHTTGAGEGNTWITALDISMGVEIAPASSALITYGGAVLTYGD